MSRAILVTSDFPPAFGGGISRYYYTWCLHTKCTVSVVAPNYDDAALFDTAQPFPIYRQWVPVQRFFLLRLLQALILVWRGSLIAKRAHARVIVLGHWYFAFFGFIAHYFFHLPFIVVLHGGELDRFQSNSVLRRIAIACIEQSNAIVVNSDYTAQRYRKDGGRHSRIVKIAPSVDTRLFSRGVDFEDIIQRHNLRDRRVLLTVSRLVERKGHDTVIKALPLILKTIPNCVYLVVGIGPEEKRLRTLAYDLGVSNRVIFAANVPDTELPAYYNTCDIFVMPSRSLSGREGVEGFGIAYLEASACGKVVIGGRSGGVAEAVTDGMSGVLVDPLDEQFLAQTIITLLTDTDLAAQLGSQGRAITESNYDAEIQSQNLDQLLAQI